MARTQQIRKSKKICQITGKGPKMGGKIIHRGVSKKAGGIGLQLVKNVKRKFRPNLQRVRVLLPNGQVKRIWVCAKALKAGKVMKSLGRPPVKTAA